jgi:hypothetical protein
MRTSDIESSQKDRLSARIEEMFPLFSALLVFATWQSIFGGAAALGFGLELQTIGADVGRVLNSPYLNSMLEKNTIQAEALWFKDNFYRPRGLQMYPNTLAGILCATMPLKFYFVKTKWRNQKLVSVAMLAVIFLDINTIVACLSRSAWVAFGITIGVNYFLASNHLSFKSLAYLIFIIVCASLFLLFFGETVGLRIFEKAHSNEARILNYSLVFEYVFSDIVYLLFGAATQIDHDLLDIPLGSHSTYIGILFKHGIIGFVLYITFLAMVFRRLLGLFRLSVILRQEERDLVKALGFGVIFFLIQGSLIEIDVDAAYYLSVITFFSILVFLTDRLGSLPIKRAENVSRVDATIPTGNAY